MTDAPAPSPSAFTTAAAPDADDWAEQAPPAPDQPLAAAPADPAAPPPVTYDPADYRWVPVRRQPRYDGWTEEKQRRFIEVLADTGLVNAAAKAVGMSRESAYRLRRAAHAAAFARAWDAARHHAGSALEDIAFERAIEGVELDVYDESGAVVSSRRVYNDRLLTFLLTHLKPERYARAAREKPEPPPAPVAAVLAALEPALPAPPETLLDAGTLAHELDLAEMGDGELPHFLNEQRPVKSPQQLAAEAVARQRARGEAVYARSMNPSDSGKLSDTELEDLCAFLDPTQARGQRRRRSGETFV